MRTIRSNKHEIASYELNKISLSCFGDKRYINDNGQTSLAYGHRTGSGASQFICGDVKGADSAIFRFF